VQVTSSQIEIWELRQLVVVIRDARAGREVWQGRIVERHREDFGPHVGNAVAGLLSHFPMVAPAAPAIPDTQPRAVAAVDRRPADGAPRRNAGRPGD
jgi:hypothetical protein